MTFFAGLLEALRIGTGFLWTAGWAIVMGLMITSWVQVYVSKERIAGLPSSSSSCPSRSGTPSS